MGAWGTGLYDDDMTCDVRDTYMDFLREQYSNEEAYKKILEIYGDDDENYEPLFWFALAETQWRVGRLTPEVKEKALEWIEKKGAAGLWEGTKAGVEPWLKTLDKLKETLNSPMRSEKKIRKPPVIDQNPWNLGDVYAYQFHTEKSKKYGTFGKYVVLQKMGEGKDDFHSVKDDISKSPTIMRIHIFDKLFDNMPKIEDINGVRLLPITRPHENYNLLMNILIEPYKKKDYPAEHLFYLGNAPIPISKIVYTQVAPTFWTYNTGDSGIELIVNGNISLWKDEEYVDIEEGVFRSKRSLLDEGEQES